MSTDLSHRSFGDIADIRARFERLFEELLGGRHSDGAWSMAIDVQRENGNLKVRADMPGMKPEDVKVSVEEGVLTISAQHDESTESDEEGYVRRERHYGSFRRSITLPAEAEVGEIDATTKDGVVEVTIPIAEAKPAEKVEIQPHAA